MTEIVWNDASESSWRAALEACGQSSVEQCWGYGEASAANGFTVDRGVVVRGGDTIGVVQAFTKRFLGAATVTQILRGPLWTGGEPDLEAIHPVLAHLRERFTKGRFRLVYWLPELPALPAAHAAMLRIRLRRVMSGYHSAWVDLQRAESDIGSALSSPWRNQLRRAEKEKLSVGVAHGGQDLEMLLARYDENRRERRFGGPNGKFIRALIEGTSDRRDALILTARRGREPVAGVFLFRHGLSATYYAGWTTPEGRTVHAHNALLWRGAMTVKKAGVQWLDLGGLDTTNAPGIARFKLGMGGTVFSLAGSYL
ncbi:MAG: GNAT family N-acetyltransferase [Proteobacteria bacterium]|nr:GNAT family N-acetyltransferase [Pseudomonadota bacterium]MDA1059704.1 GNAT family N-acetyltransferase [Pseudomonadota bacterium]